MQEEIRKHVTKKIAVGEEEPTADEKLEQTKKNIEAAIKSVPGNYLYFVAKGDGSHVFSKTYEEHNKAVKKYIYSK